MPNYYNIQGGVGTQAGNMEDIGMMVEMDLQRVTYNNNNLIYNYLAGNANMYALKMWEWPGVRLTSSYIYRYINNACMIPHEYSIKNVGVAWGEANFQLLYTIYILYIYYINNACYHVSTKITHHWKLCSSRWLTVSIVGWRETRGNGCIASSTWRSCMHISILKLMTLIIK